MGYLVFPVEKKSAEEGAGSLFSLLRPLDVRRRGEFRSVKKELLKTLRAEGATSEGGDLPLWVWKGSLKEPLEGDPGGVVWIHVMKGAGPLWIGNEEGPH